MPLRRKARTAVALARGAVADGRRRRAIGRARPALGAGVRVSYGVRTLPGTGEPLSGGLVKFQRLAAVYPNAPLDFNLLYLGSSSRPRDSSALIRLARARGAAVVWNQDGVAYPGWHGPGWERANEPMAKALHAADHVFFQSAFCRLSADRFLGERSGPSEILYNAVDTGFFAPASPPVGPADGARPLTLLLGGSQYQWYRVEVALRTLAELLHGGLEARLIVTGALVFDPEPARARSRVADLGAGLGLADRVELTGPFTQAAAPSVYRRADVLLHPKVNDPCPGTVLEAMACGLPVVYSATGGVPELVGADAGVGIPGPLDFEHDHLPSPEELADAVQQVAGSLAEQAAAARERAVERFDLQPWVERHRAVFERLAP